MTFSDNKDSILIDIYILHFYNIYKPLVNDI